MMFLFYVNAYELLTAGWFLWLRLNDVTPRQALFERKKKLLTKKEIQKEKIHNAIIKRDHKKAHGIMIYIMYTFYIYAG